MGGEGGRKKCQRRKMWMERLAPLEEPKKTGGVGKGLMGGWEGV